MLETVQCQVLIFRPAPLKIRLQTTSTISFCYLLLITLNGIHTLFSISDFEQTLRKMSKFRLISRRRNFVETHSFGRVLGDFPETLQKLLHQKFRWNYGILCSDIDAGWATGTLQTSCYFKGIFDKMKQDSLSAVSTAWKVSKYVVISGPCFPVFGLNTEIYGVNFRI